MKGTCPGCWLGGVCDNPPSLQQERELPGLLPQPTNLSQPPVFQGGPKADLLSLPSRSSISVGLIVTSSTPLLLKIHRDCDDVVVL